MEYYPLHTAEYATVILASDWLYFSRHGIKYGMVWYDMVRYGIILYDTVWYIIISSILKELFFKKVSSNRDL